MAASSTPYHHGDLRQALLEAARQAVERDGAGALSLRELARGLGVSHNAPYRHFPDREALLDALCAEGFAELTLRLEGVRARTPARRLSAMGEAYVAFADAHPGVFALMFQPVDPSLRPLTTPVATGAMALLADGVRGVTGLADPTDVTAMWAVAHGLATLRMTGHLARDRASVVRAVTQRMADAIAPRR